MLLTFAIGVTVFGGYMYYRFENTMSFDYTGVEDEKKAAEALAGENHVLFCLFFVLCFFHSFCSHCCLLFFSVPISAAGGTEE